MPITSDMNTSNPRRLDTLRLIRAFGTEHGFIPVPGTELLREWNKSDLIGLFELYVYLWTIEPAEILLNRTSDGSTPNPNGDFAVLNILNPLPEFLGRCLSGSRDFQDGYARFKQGMKYITKHDSATESEVEYVGFRDKANDFFSDVFYYYLRNGLAHLLYTYRIVSLDRVAEAEYKKTKGKLSVFYINSDKSLEDLINGYPFEKAKAKDRKRYIEKNNVEVRLDAQNYFLVNKIAIDSYVEELDIAEEDDELYRNFRFLMTGCR